MVIKEDFKMSRNKDYTNYKNMVNLKTQVLEETETVKTVKAESFKSAIVFNCNQLNVREKPSRDSKIVDVLDKDTEIRIKESESTKDFYKILTILGVTGYCMKEYISVE